MRLKEEVELQIRNQVWNQVDGLIRERVSQRVEIWGWSQIGGHIYNQVGDRVYDPILGQAREDNDDR